MTRRRAVIRGAEDPREFFKKSRKKLLTNGKEKCILSKLLQNSLKKENHSKKL